MNRGWLLAGALALYVLALGRGPAGRLVGQSGFDPLASRPGAVEQLIVAGRFAEARPLALGLLSEYPDEPVVFHWLATINHALARWHEEADAWTAYVRTSAAPEEACPAWPSAYRRSGDEAGARAAAARCQAMARP